MEDALITLLEKYKLPVIRQGSLAEDATYPETFITFWNREENGFSYYDNDCLLSTSDFEINVYSSNPNTTYSLLRTIKADLKAAGWSVNPFGYDVASDEITHTGRGMRVSFLQTE